MVKNPSKCLLFLQKRALTVKLFMLATVFLTSLPASALSFIPHVSSLTSAVIATAPLDGNKISLRARNSGDDYATLEVFYAGKFLGSIKMSVKMSY